MSFNKIIIVGNCGRDPELKYTPQGTAVCKLSVATTEKRKDASGDYQSVTTWFRVTVWSRQAELCAEYLGKGKQVYIEGRLRLDEYTDKDGNVRLSPEVNATDVQFIGSRDEGSASKPKDEFDGAREFQERQEAKKGAVPKRASREELEGEIPF